MRTTFDCVLNSYGFGIRSSEIACDLRFANELEMGLKTGVNGDRGQSIQRDRHVAFTVLTTYERRGYEHIHITNGDNNSPFATQFFWNSE